MSAVTMSITSFKNMAVAQLQAQLAKGDIIIVSGKTKLAVVCAYKEDAKGNYIRPATLGGKALPQ